ncbi:MAG: hypothetical protein IKT67_05125 [Lachnospiraceae bacterium]|nr:hypothetical protein [Lachnospiraceae bacterium]
MVTEKETEKNRRKAFWGLQLKYTLTPLVLLYGGAFVVMTGLFLYNLIVNVKPRDGVVWFVDQMSALPVTAMFFVLIIGSQVIVGRGFLKQERNEPGMRRLQLFEETRALIRFEYSLLISFTSYLINFLILCLLLVLDNVLVPSHALGGAEMHAVFYRFTHLYRLYPFLKLWALPAAAVVILACAVMSPLVVKVRSKLDIVYGMEIPFLFLALAYFSLGPSKGGIYGSIVFMAVRGLWHCGKYVYLYVRRQKDDRTEFAS